MCCVVAGGPPEVVLSITGASVPTVDHWTSPGRGTEDRVSASQPGDRE